MPTSQQQNRDESGLFSNLLQSIMHLDTLHHHEKHTNEQVSDLFTSGTKIMDFGCHFSWYMTSALFLHKIVCFQKWSLVLMWQTTFAISFTSFCHWHGASCITFALCWTTRVVCSFWDQNSNLVACEVREMPLTLQSIECIQPACLHTFLSLYSEKGPRPSDRGHRGL